MIKLITSKDLFDAENINGFGQKTAYGDLICPKLDCNENILEKLRTFLLNHTVFLLITFIHLQVKKNYNLKLYTIKLD